jgi:tRNA threonylcarbamoyladenosine modification (KEOPS) complex  Pcc1 subunit
MRLRSRIRLPDEAQAQVHQVQREEIQHMVQKEATDHKDGSRKISSLIVRIKLPAEAAEVCCKAIEAETAADMVHRSVVTISHDNNTLTLEIEAEDLTALRASMNTYLRWADMCLTLTKGE